MHGIATGLHSVPVHANVLVPELELPTVTTLVAPASVSVFSFSSSSSVDDSSGSTAIAQCAQPHWRVPSLHPHPQQPLLQLSPNFFQPASTQHLPVGAHLSELAGTGAGLAGAGAGLAGAGAPPAGHVTQLLG